MAEEGGWFLAQTFEWQMCGVFICQIRQVYPACMLKRQNDIARKKGKSRKGSKGKRGFAML